jgi:hypothetical protein
MDTRDIRNVCMPSRVELLGGKGAVMPCDRGPRRKHVLESGQKHGHDDGVGDGESAWDSIGARREPISAGRRVVTLSPGTWREWYVEAKRCGRTHCPTDA